MPEPHEHVWRVAQDHQVWAAPNYEAAVRAQIGRCCVVPGCGQVDVGTVTSWEPATDQNCRPTFARSIRADVLGPEQQPAG